MQLRWMLLDSCYFVFCDCVYQGECEENVDTPWSPPPPDKQDEKKKDPHDDNALFIKEQVLG